MRLGVMRMLLHFELLMAIPRDTEKTPDAIRDDLEAVIKAAMRLGLIDATTCVVGAAKTVGEGRQ